MSSEIIGYDAYVNKYIEMYNRHGGIKSQDCVAKNKEDRKMPPTMYWFIVYNDGTQARASQECHKDIFKLFDVDKKMRLVKCFYYLEHTFTVGDEQYISYEQYLYE